MFAMCGYDFLLDGNALNPTTVPINNYTNVKLTNGIFDHWNVTKDVTTPVSTNIPTEWELLTIMNANFEGNIRADNLGGFIGVGIDGIKIKRRKINDFDWVTLKYIPINTLEDFTFVFQDNLAQSGQEYEYAFVSVAGGIEGNYITDSIGSEFDGVFICDAETVYKFYSDVTYGNTQRVQQIGVFEPYGRKYPVLVSNGLVNYSTGTLSGKIIPNEFFETRVLDKYAISKESKELVDFLTNKKAKIIKDWAGRIWLVVITDNPNISYIAKSQLNMLSASMNWTEIGDANSQEDLFSSGMVTEVE